MSRLAYLFLRIAVALVAALAISSAPQPGRADSLAMLSGFPALRQQHPLTCEASAASMGTQGVLSEAKIMTAMPRNPNPNLGFRGNPNGEQGTTLINYGVYANPVHRALLRYGYQSDVLTYATRSDITASINRGWPVVAWITYRLQRATPRLSTYKGVSFTLVPHEHAVLIIGYDAKTVIANDPWTGAMVRYYWWEFQRSWGLFGNMALSMEPCPAPSEVSSIAVTGMDVTGLTWTWPRAKYAAQYRIKVIRHTAVDTVVFQGIQLPHRFTLANPVAGATYQIVVRSVSTCGGTARPTKLWVTLPATLPQPTPSTPEGTVVVPTGTPVHATPTATPKAT